LTGRVTRVERRRAAGHRDVVLLVIQLDRETAAGSG